MHGLAVVNNNNNNNHISIPPSVVTSENCLVHADCKSAVIIALDVALFYYLVTYVWQIHKYNGIYGTPGTVGK